MAPFNTRFLGALYLTQLTATAILSFVARWPPSRVALPAVLAFTLVVTIALLLNLGRLDFQRRAAWLWLFLTLFQCFC